MIIIKFQFLQLQASVFDPGILSQQQCDAFSYVVTAIFVYFFLLVDF